MSAQQKHHYGQINCMMCGNVLISQKGHVLKIETDKIEGTCCCDCAVVAAYNVCNVNKRISQFYVYMHYDDDDEKRTEYYNKHKESNDELIKLIGSYIPVNEFAMQNENIKKAFEIITKYIQFDTRFEALRYVIKVDKKKILYIANNEIESATKLLWVLEHMYPDNLH